MIVKPYANPWPDPDYIDDEERMDNLRWALALSGDEQKLDALSGLDTPEKVNDFIKNVMLKDTLKQ